MLRVGSRQFDISDTVSISALRSNDVTFPHFSFPASSPMHMSGESTVSISLLFLFSISISVTLSWV